MLAARRFGPWNGKITIPSCRLMAKKLLIIVGRASDRIVGHYSDYVRSWFARDIVGITLGDCLIVNGAIGVASLLTHNVIKRGPLRVSHDKRFVIGMNWIDF